MTCRPACLAHIDPDLAACWYSQTDTGTQPLSMKYSARISAPRGNIYTTPPAPRDLFPYIQQSSDPIVPSYTDPTVTTSIPTDEMTTLFSLPLELQGMIFDHFVKDTDMAESCVARQVSSMALPSSFKLFPFADYLSRVFQALDRVHHLHRSTALTFR